MPKRSAPSPAGAVHPIQVVVRRTGLSADVVRVWEKRYGVVTPVRTATGRRLYSDADVARLQLLARATLTGRTIGQVAALPAAALAAVVRESDGDVRGTRATGAGADGDGAARPPALDHLGACLDAVGRFDGVTLDALLRRATVALSAEAFLDALVLPLEHRVGERVRDGGLGAPHRHLTQAVLRRVVDHVAAVATVPFASPDLVVTTPSGQSQELGALLTAAAAATEGWRVTYVGAGLPAEDVVATVGHTGARAVALSLGAASGDRGIPRELRRLRSLLPSGVPLLVEGVATVAHRAVLAEIDAVVLRDLPALRTRLRLLRQA